MLHPGKRTLDSTVQLEALLGALEADPYKK